MKYIVNSDQIDRLMKSYFDMIFNDSVIEYGKLSDDNPNIFQKIIDKSGKLIMARQKGTEMWLVNFPEFFINAEHIFNINKFEFIYALERYLVKKTGLEFKYIV